MRATSPISGKKEDHYVLIMSYLARDYLEAAGATVRMTRFDNSMLPGLQERVNFSNACGAASFNAVHLNSAANVNARGLELYYRSKNATSQAQARSSQPGSAQSSSSQSSSGQSSAQSARAGQPSTQTQSSTRQSNAGDQDIDVAQADRPGSSQQSQNRASDTSSRTMPSP